MLTRVKNLVVRDVTLQNSPKFHLVPTECDGVLITGVTILAPEGAANTDAIDPSMCRNVTITKCLIDVGDDNVAIKSGEKVDGTRVCLREHHDHRLHVQARPRRVDRQRNDGRRQECAS